MSPVVLKVLCGTSLLGATAGVIGCFAVLRRRALVGDVLAHAALPGICLAFLVMGQRQVAGLLLGGLIAGLLALVCMQVATQGTRTKSDAATAIVLSTFFAAGVVLLSIIQRRPGGASQSGLSSYIYGQAATLTRADVALIALVAVVSLGIVVLLYKEFKLVSFDPDFAHSQGWPTRRLDLLLMGTLAVVTVAGLPAAGVVLMAALLIVPGAAARFWSDRLSRVLGLSAAFGCLASALGTAVSAGWHRGWWGAAERAEASAGWPTGPLIVLSAVVLFAVSALFAPRRGVVARSWSQWQLRRQTSGEHLLRALYELSETALPERPSLSLAALIDYRAWSPREVGRLVAWATRQGWLESTAGCVRLTPAGLERAAAVTRRHRLWELYLIRDARVAADHVDRDADATEHWLSDELVARLEAEFLAGSAAAAAPAGVPASPHELATGAVATETPSATSPGRN